MNGLAGLSRLLRRDRGVVPCLFCDARVLQRHIRLRETDELVAIADHKPKAAHHFLVLPRRHIENSDALMPDDIPLVRAMLSMGRELVREAAGQGGLEHAIFGFHRSPFTSVEHLHLHCLVPPFTPSYQALRFNTVLGTFTTADELLMLREI
jgi:diadenosine tetraphosphate (Ap4A) HIT family hydrolase